MLFNSINFLLFFPVAVMGYFLIPHKIRYIWLLLCSYFFYMCWNVSYAILILISTVVTYTSGIVLSEMEKRVVCDKKKRRYMKLVIFVSFAVNLGILGYFKYYNFFVDNVNYLMNSINFKIIIPKVDVLLPVGISFYTFQALSYTADVFRGEISAEKNFLKYALFVSFFPQLVAGPIERSGNLLGQLNEKHFWNYERVRDGLLLMIWGYFLKVVLADRISIFVDAVYGDTSTYGGWYLIVASILFAFQIYCDFAGYSTIALGAAEVMGFQLTDNFNAPYFSHSNSEFWQRWHISLFSWFKDYIYIPLGGNRKGKIRKYINIMIVFLISGLWHGATWAFVIWGGINGFYQIVGDVLKPIRKRINELFKLDTALLSHKLFQILFTFILVDISWVFFRTGKAKEAFRCLYSMLHANNTWILFDNSLFTLGLDWKNFAFMICCIFILMVSDYFKYKGYALRKLIVQQELWFRWTVYIVAIMSIFVFGIYGSKFDVSGFIYFQF